MGERRSGLIVPQPSKQGKGLVGRHKLPRNLDCFDECEC